MKMQRISLFLLLSCFFPLSWAQTEPVVGECDRYMGRRQESCKSGIFHHRPGHTETEFRWSCRNIPYDGEAVCSESKFLTEFAECGEVYWGPYDASCKKGAHHPHPGHTAKEFRWTCRNIPHNGEVQCSLPRPIIGAKEEPKPSSEDEPETETDSAEGRAKNPAENPTENPKEKEESELRQTTLLVTLSNDYKTEEKLDLMVATDAQNHITSIQIKKGSEEKSYSVEQFKQKIPLMKVKGITLIQFQCLGFSPEHGCTVQIEYPHSMLHASFRTFRTRLKLQDGKWGLYQDGRHFQSIHVVVNRWWGIPIGIKEVQLR